MLTNSKSADHVKARLQATKGLNSEQVAKFYDSWAPTYEQDVETLAYDLRPLVVDCLHANFSGKREEVQVLDVACGSGGVARLMAELGFKYFVGVDCSKNMLEEAAKLGLYQDLKLALLGTQPLPVETGTFDVVIIAGGFGEGYIPVCVLRELCSAAKSGGLICMSMGAHSIAETFTKNLESEMKLMEEEGLWSPVVIKAIDRYMESPFVNTEKEEERFIGGTAYLFKKSTQ